MARRPRPSSSRHRQRSRRRAGGGGRVAVCRPARSVHGRLSRDPPVRWLGSGEGRQRVAG